MGFVPWTHKQSNPQDAFKTMDQVDRDIQAMEENGETCQEAVKKLSTGLLGKLGKMAKGVDDLLNTAASKCR